MHTHSTPSRRGSIYLITLVTVAAIVSIVLIGVSLRQASNNNAALVELMSANSTAPFDASEYAIARIYDSPDWITEAQKGAAFSDFTLGDRTYTSSVLDADTLATPTDSTTVYRVQVGARHGSANAAARFDLRYERFDYKALLENFELQHYWPLNEKNNPTKAEDKKGSYQGAYMVPSIAGSGTNDEEGWVPVFADDNDYIKIPWGSDFQQSEASMAMWVKWTGNELFKFYGILGILRSRSSSDSPTLSIGIYNNRLVAYVSENGSFDSNKLVWSSSAIPKSEWFHIVLSWGGGGLQIYVNGSQAGANDANIEGTSSYIRFPWLVREPMLIGAGYEIASSSYTLRGFEGSIAHVAMFNNQLSADHVAKLAAQKPDEIESEILAGSWVRELGD